MSLSSYTHLFDNSMAAVIQWLSSPALYSQLGLTLLSVLFAHSCGRLVKSKLSGKTSENALKNHFYQAADILVPLIYIVMFAIAMAISKALIQQDAVIRFFQGIAIVVLCHAVVTRIVIHSLLKAFFVWSLPPMILVYVVGAWEATIAYLDGIKLHIGHIIFSTYDLMSTVFFGMLLFWSGRAINRIGQQLIRQRQDLDVGTQEVFVKLFEVLLILSIFFILLQIIGINLTTMAVFGGALGVGLGFGLQSIASNFISGIILLLDRSLLVGDYIELEDGRKGTIRELSMRSATLETYDGKDIVVPNEKFITSSFTNWTHKDTKQRYSLEFQVAYKTDLHTLLPLLKETVAQHPSVMSGDDTPEEERPDAEISGFGESGVNILIEYWMDGVDDGKNRVGADLFLMIWDALKEHVVEIPFPQREVRLVGDALGQEKSSKNR